MTGTGNKTFAEDDVDTAEIDETIGTRLCRFVAVAPGGKKRKQLRHRLELLGIVSIGMVPTGLAWVHGAVGTVVAIAGGSVAVLCYLMTARGRKPLVTTLDVGDRGVRCSQAAASRTLVWNEIVDLTSRSITLPNGQKSIMLCFEVVAEPPLLMLLGGSFGEQQSTRDFLQKLGQVWLGIWARRACAMLDNGQQITVGNATATSSYVSINDVSVRWDAISGVESSDAQAALVAPNVAAIAGHYELQDVIAFPSASERLARLARR